MDIARDVAKIRLVCDLHRAERPLKQPATPFMALVEIHAVGDRDGIYEVSYGVRVVFLVCQNMKMVAHQAVGGNLGVNLLVFDSIGAIFFDVRVKIAGHERYKFLFVGRVEEYFLLARTPVVNVIIGWRVKLAILYAIHYPIIFQNYTFLQIKGRRLLNFPAFKFSISCFSLLAGS